MDRLSPGSTISAHSPPPDVALSQLTQLLSRLQQNLLHPSPERERRLRTREYERARAQSNLEYARSVLTKLEHDALRVKAPTKRVEAQALLNANRERLETLLDRLEDLRQLAANDDASSDEEDLLGAIESDTSESAIPNPLQQADEPHIPTLTPEPPAPSPQPTISTSQPSATATPPPAQTSRQPSSLAPTQTTQSLRSRSTQSPSPSSSSQPTSHTTARAALFANRPKASEPQTSTATAEAILDQQRAEQDSLQESILKMASALKSSSHKFSSTLEADKDILSRAGDGISKTEQSMDSARGRMGMLTRMTEGKGWWGRMMLYAWVYGLMVGLVLFVFVMPKLRF